MNRTIKFLIVLLFFSISLQGCLGSRRTVNNIYNDGIRFKSTGEYGRATDSFKKVIKLAPRSKKAIKALYMLGEVYYETGETGRAIRVFEGYIDIAKPAPDKKFEVLKKIADLYHLKLSDYEKALEFYKKALVYTSSERSVFDVLLNTARAYYKLNRFQEAISFFDTAARAGEQLDDSRLYLQVQEALYYTAYSYSILRDQMTDISRTYAGLDPSDPIKRIIGILDKCIELSETSRYGVLCRFEKADNLVQIDQKEEALAILEELREVYPNRSVIEARINRLSN